MGNITVYLAHDVSPRRLLHRISMLAGTGQFLMPPPLEKLPLTSTPGNVGILCYISDDKNGMYFIHSLYKLRSDC